MQRLLDNDLLAGPYEVNTVLRPERCARPVATDDMAGLLKEIERLCQVWGGAGHPVIPISAGKISEPYARLLQTEQIDLVGGLKQVAFDAPRGVEKGTPWDHPIVVLASREPLDRMRPIRVADLASDDPWRPIYAAALGSLPHRPDPGLSEFAGMRDDLRFEDVVPVEREQVVGSIADLLDRVADRGHMSPRQFSGAFLAAGMEPDTGFIGPQDILPDSQVVRRAAGPNIIVAMAPDSVADVVLLWNLRVAHGDQRVLPLGLPVSDITAEVLRELESPGRATMFGLGGGKCHVTSASQDLSVLEDIAARSPAAVAATFEDLLTFGPAPGRPRSQVAIWTDGRARIGPLSESDQEVLSPTRSMTRRPRLILDATVGGYPLPADPALRGPRFGPRFQSGPLRSQSRSPAVRGPLRSRGRPPGRALPQSSNHAA